jgi:hypothetical protein
MPTKYKIISEYQLQDIQTSGKEREGNDEMQLPYLTWPCHSLTFMSTM